MCKNFLLNKTYKFTNIIFFSKLLIKFFFNSGFKFKKKIIKSNQNNKITNA